MGSKVLVIISSGDVDKALTGLMYATNALKYKWLDDVEVVFFGPVERLIAKGDEKLLDAIREFSKYKRRPLACKRIAELEGFEDKLREHVEVVYVGSEVSRLIKAGYIPLVF
ncbi:MAG: hypothetical protein GSR80_000750 [Desulfurococcales archaeon]|nr:hypothetical protein [Desulfurococcales archaeon]